MSAQGIEKIKIPVRANEVSFGVIEKYLPIIFDKFKEISKKIRKDYDIYRLNHAILNKTRYFDENSDINHKILVPSVKAMVDWKVGYILGNPISYAQSKVESTDDIEYLNKYDRDVCKATVDEEVYVWVCSTGVGYYFIEPKSVAFADGEAPYNLYSIEADRCAKIYSSYLGNEELFDIVYTTHKRVDNDREYIFDILDVYLKDQVITYERPSDTISQFKHKYTQSRGIPKPLPLVEKRGDYAGIGIVSLCKSMQDAVDRVLSNGLDNIEEVVNQIFVYKNVDLGATPEEMADNHSNMVRNGAVVVNDATPETKASVDTIKPDLKLNEFVEIYNVLYKALHDTAGVPIEESNTNSGGTTKSGSEIANGYENAYNRAMSEKNMLVKADYELLKKILWICKNSTDNKINNVSASDINIKYNFNVTDNILIKSQAFGTLIQYMPADMALRATRLSNDPEKEGARIDKKIAEQKEIANQNQNNQNITE
jgi:SPP1 family phage portal protein